MQIRALPHYHEKKQIFKTEIIDPILTIKKLVETNPEAQDVHLFDDFVFKGRNQLPCILEISSEFLPENETLTFAQIQRSMVDFIRRNPTCYTSYNGVPLTHNVVINYVNQALSNIEANMTSVQEIHD